MLNRKFKCLDRNRSLKRFLIERKTSAEISLIIAGLLTYMAADKDLIMNLDKSCHILFLNMGVVLTFIWSKWSNLVLLTKKMCFISFEFLARIVIIFAFGNAIWFLLASFFKKLEYFQPGDLSFGAISIVFCSYFIMCLMLLYPFITKYKETFLRWRKKTVLYYMANER